MEIHGRLIIHHAGKKQMKNIIYFKHDSGVFFCIALQIYKYIYLRIRKKGKTPHQKYSEKTAVTAGLNELQRS